MKTIDQVKAQWNKCLKERQEHALVIDRFKINPPVTEDERNRHLFAKNSFAHLSAWLQALEFVMK